MQRGKHIIERIAERMERPLRVKLTSAGRQAWMNEVDVITQLEKDVYKCTPDSKVYKLVGEKWVRFIY